MTLDDAIRNEYDTACQNANRPDIYLAHIQLAEWLEELKALRIRNARLSKITAQAIRNSIEVNFEDC